MRSSRYTKVDVKTVTKKQKVAYDTVCKNIRQPRPRARPRSTPRARAAQRTVDLPRGPPRRQDGQQTKKSLQDHPQGHRPGGAGRHQAGRRSAAPACAPRQLGLGPARPVRVRRQLVDQHRQRLLRRAAVHPGTWRAYGGAAACRTTPAARPADRRRQEGPGRAGLGAVAGLHRPSWVCAERATSGSGLLDPRAAVRRARRRRSACGPTKQRGQNFVTDANTVRRIVAASGVRPDDVVLEIGPGLGSLTLGLLEAAAQVVAVEIDPLLAGALPATVTDRMPGAGGRAHASITADALRIDDAAVRADRGGGQPALQRLRPGPAAPAGDLPELAARTGDGPGRGRRPAGRRSGVEDLRRPLGQDGLVRRRRPGSAACRPRCSGRCPTSTRVWSRSCGARAEHHRDPSARSSRSSMPPSPSGARCCGRALAGLVGSSAAASDVIVAAGLDPQARGEVLDVDRLRPARRTVGPVSLDAARDDRVTGAIGSAIASTAMASPHLPPSPVGVRVRVPAKINLALKVGPPRPDGFHPLATVYQAVSLYDEVHAAWADPGSSRSTVTGEGADLGAADDSNLAVRAARLLARTHGAQTRSGSACRSTNPSRSPAGWPAVRPTGPRRCWPARRCGTSTCRGQTCGRWPRSWAATCRSP